MPPARKCSVLHGRCNPNDGSSNGRLGGTDKITAPDDRLLIDDAVEAKVLAQLRPGRQLAKRRRFPKDGGEPLPVLDTNSRAVAKTWADAMSYWVKSPVKPDDGVGPRRRY